jgi:hypothetical protein
MSHEPMKKDFDLMRGFRRTLILLLVPTILLILSAIFTVRVCGCQPPIPTLTNTPVVRFTVVATRIAPALTATAISIKTSQARTPPTSSDR